MRKALPVMILVCFTLAGVASAQGQAQPPLTTEQRALRAFNNVQGKLIAIAKDLPEDKFDYRPHKDVRSMIEELWHATAANISFAAQFKNEQIDRQKLFSTEGKPRTRAELVAQLENSVSAVSKLIEASFDARIIGLAEHAGEHYGKLVTMYRINGLVPPQTRDRQQ